MEVAVCAGIMKFQAVRNRQNPFVNQTHSFLRKEETNTNTPAQAGEEIIVLKARGRQFPGNAGAGHVLATNECRWHQRDPHPPGAIEVQDPNGCILWDLSIPVSIPFILQGNVAEM